MGHGFVNQFDVFVFSNHIFINFIMLFKHTNTMSCLEISINSMIELAEYKI